MDSLSYNRLPDSSGESGNWFSTLTWAAIASGISAMAPSTLTASPSPHAIHPPVKGGSYYGTLTSNHKTRWYDRQGVHGEHPEPGATAAALLLSRLAAFSHGRGWELALGMSLG